MSSYETPEYAVKIKDGSFELRQYDKFQVARVDTKNRNDGFRTLFQYISGANEEQEKISMTVPVIQEQTEEKRTMAFVVPKEYEENVPSPMDGGVAIERMTWSYVAVIRFSGLASERRIRLKGRELHDWIRKKGWIESGMQVVAFYDPPFQVPFLRRNEVMIGINWKEDLDNGKR
jgi:multidrug efflux pump subunit AcrA (membrane-fusion protein)